MAASVKSALRILARHVEAFDLTRGNLGVDAMTLAVDCMAQDAAAGVGPDGNRWPDLCDAYARWKARRFPGRTIGFREGLMLGRDQLEGEHTVEPHRAELRYGTTQQARDEARWFEDGDDARNRPPREFWGLSDRCVALTDQLFERHGKTTLR